MLCDCFSAEQLERIEAGDLVETEVVYVDTPGTKGEGVVIKVNANDVTVEVGGNKFECAFDQCLPLYDHDNQGKKRSWRWSMTIRSTTVTTTCDQVAREREQLNEMSTVELAAYWNIIQMQLRMMGDRSQAERHGPIVKELLQGRGVQPQDGKRLTKAAGATL
jgi:hypothetical protein